MQVWCHVQICAPEKGVNYIKRVRGGTYAREAMALKVLLQVAVRLSELT